MPSTRNGASPEQRRSALLPFPLHGNPTRTPLRGGRDPGRGTRRTPTRAATTTMMTVAAVATTATSLRLAQLNSGAIRRRESSAARSGPCRGASDDIRRDGESTQICCLHSARVAKGRRGGGGPCPPDARIPDKNNKRARARAPSLACVCVCAINRRQCRQPDDGAAFASLATTATAQCEDGVVCGTEDRASFSSSTTSSSFTATLPPLPSHRARAPGRPRRDHFARLRPSSRASGILTRDLPFRSSFIHGTFSELATSSAFSRVPLPASSVQREHTRHCREPGPP